MQTNRLWTLLVSGVLAWLLTLLLGIWGPILAGLVAGVFAPRKGAFRWAALGTALAWLVWFGISALSAPIGPLAQLLGQIVGLGATGGLALPVLAAILAGIVAGVAASASHVLLSPAIREVATSPSAAS